MTTIATCDQSYFQPKIGIIWSYKFITSCPRYSWNILKLISCGLFLIINSSCPIPDSLSPNFLWQDNFPKCVKNLSKMLPKNIQIPTKISNRPTPKSVHKVANFFYKDRPNLKSTHQPKCKKKKKDHIRGIPPTELTCSQSSCTLPMPYPVVPTQPTLQKSYTQISKAVEWWKKVQYMSGERQQPSKQSPRPSTWSSVLRQTAAASCSLGFSDDAILRQVLFMLPFPLPNKIRRILESYPSWPLCLIWS